MSTSGCESELVDEARRDEHVRDLTIAAEPARSGSEARVTPAKMKPRLMRIRDTKLSAPGLSGRPTPYSNGTETDTCRRDAEAAANAHCRRHHGGRDRSGNAGHCERRRCIQGG